MEEQVLTKKQYKTLKFVRGWLMALFVISIIGGVGSVTGLVSVVALSAMYTTLAPQIAIVLIAFIPVVILLIMLGTMLFNKGPNRKNAVSTTMLVLAVMNAAFGVFNIIAGNPSAAMSAGYSFYGNLLPALSSSNAFMNIAYILAAVSAAIILLFAILLYRKTRQMPNRTFPNKLLFIVYIVLTFVFQLTLIILLIPSGMPGYIGLMITIVALTGFFTFMSLFPFIALYKALDDDIFYEHFIAKNPSAAISRYEQVLYRPAAGPEAAGYCVNCGKPLSPGAVYCRECGHKAGERIHKKED